MNKIFKFLAGIFSESYFVINVQILNLPQGEAFHVGQENAESYSGPAVEKLPGQEVVFLGVLILIADSFVVVEDERCRQTRDGDDDHDAIQIQSIVN